MRVLQSLVKDHTEKKKQKQQYMEFDEEDDMYMEMPKSVPFNQNQGVFYKEDRSINVDKSVFDRTAVFHTTES